MIELTQRSTGHTVRTDEASVEFWKAAGYVLATEPEPKPARKRSAKKAAEKPSGDKS